MGLWILGGGLLVVWLLSVLAGKGGFIHILFFSGVAIVIVQWIASRPAIED